MVFSRNFECQTWRFIHSEFDTFGHTPIKLNTQSWRICRISTRLDDRLKEFITPCFSPSDYIVNWPKSCRYHENPGIDPFSGNTESVRLYSPKLSIERIDFLIDLAMSIRKTPERSMYAKNRRFFEYELVTKKKFAIPERRAYYQNLVGHLPAEAKRLGHAVRCYRSEIIRLRAFRRLTNPRHRKMSDRSSALHSVYAHLKNPLLRLTIQDRLNICIMKGDRLLKQHLEVVHYLQNLLSVHEFQRGRHEVLK